MLALCLRDGCVTSTAGGPFLKAIDMKLTFRLPLMHCVFLRNRLDCVKGFLQMCDNFEVYKQHNMEIMAACGSMSLILWAEMNI